MVSAGIQVVWQTGKLYIERAKSIANLYDNQVFVSDFIYEMDLAYAVADVVVSRAGALSVSELCLAGKPSIFVPFPFAAEDHQTQNAMSLVKENAGILVKDADASQSLVNEALALLDNQILQNTLTTNIKKLAKPFAAKEIAEQVILLTK